MRAKGGPLVLLAHYLVLAVVGGLQALGRVTRLGRDLPLRTPLRQLLAAPQQAALLRGGRPLPTDGLAGRVSLGYLAVARRPPGS